MRSAWDRGWARRDSKSPGRRGASRFSGDRPESRPKKSAGTCGSTCGSSHGECTPAGGGSGVNGDGLQDSVIRNNVIWDAHHSGISLDQIDGGDTTITLAQWRTATNQDLASFVATPASPVVSAATGNYRLADGSAALNAGVAHAELTRDHEGTPRPQGAAHDVGAFEGSGGLFRDGFEGGSPVRWSDGEGAGSW